MAAVPRISVVVPIYNVEATSRMPAVDGRAQTVDDLEVVMVDDGSTDGSAEIAARYAERDPRFRLVRQANRGLGHARNTGGRRRPASSSRSSTPTTCCRPTRYEPLLGALERTGSDFATGNVQRLTAGHVPGAVPRARRSAPPLRPTSRASARCSPDRMAQNKLWRRSFWDAHGFASPRAWCTRTSR